MLMHQQFINLIILVHVQSTNHLLNQRSLLILYLKILVPIFIDFYIITKCDAIVYAGSSTCDLLINNINNIYTKPAKIPVNADSQILTSFAIADIATIPATLPLEIAIKLILCVFKYYTTRLVNAENVAATNVLTAINPYSYLSFFPPLFEPLMNINVDILNIIEPYPILIGE